MVMHLVHGILAMDVASCLLWSLAAFILYKVADHLLRKPRLKLAPGQTKHVLVTGCDSGFGNIFAKQLASRHSGYVVYAGCLTAAGRDDISRSQLANLKPVALDVTCRMSLSEAFNTVSSYIGQDKGLWAVVNNAGIIGSAGSVEWLDQEEYTKVLEVNLFGMMNVCKTFLPLLKRSQGRIVNTVSIIGRLALPFSSPYMVSKYAAGGYSDGLRRELQPFKVSVHIIEPGFFKTALTDPNIFGASMTRVWDNVDPAIKAEYGEDFFNGSLRTIKVLMPMMASTKLHLVTDCYEHAVTAMFPRGRYMPGLDARLFCWPLTLVPEWFSDFLLVGLSNYLATQPAGCKKYK